MTMEIIEHKSAGHPDSLTDLCVEVCATWLDQYYLRKYGHVLHYNVDKAIFSAGSVRIEFGGGEILRKPTFVLGGQASNVDSEMKRGLADSIRSVVQARVPRIPSIDVEIRTDSISSNLDHIAQSCRVLCNDTSFGVGYAPFSDAELEVLSLKNTMDMIISRRSLPVGEDYKIMSTPDFISLSAPLFAGAVKNTGQYLEVKRALELELLPCAVEFNPDYAGGFPYLTLGGSSIECGDDGQVGRGNRYNGLITPCRPMTMEAFHGKNNRNHIGKLYSKSAFERAWTLHHEDGRPVEVMMVGRIGRPVDEPDVYARYAGGGWNKA